MLLGIGGPRFPPFGNGGWRVAYTKPIKRMTHSEVGRHERVRIAESSHCDVGGRPLTDARELRETDHRFGTVGTGIDHNAPLRNGATERPKRGLLALRHPDLA